ncbi:MAG: PDZ domain-containing protein, partial [Ardenticatenales bacterium]
MNKRLLTLGLGITAALAIGVGLAFRSVVSAVAESPNATGALAHISRAWNAHHNSVTAASAVAQQAVPATGPDMVFSAGDAIALGPDAAGGKIVEGPGVLVTGVVADGPAAKAGIVRGDIVLAIEGTDVKQIMDLHKAMADKKAGDIVHLKVQHGDAVQTRDVTLSGQGMAMLGIVSCGGGMMPHIAIRRFMGGPAVIGDVTADSPAAKAGLKAGDRIVAVDGEKLAGAAITRSGGDSHMGRLFRFFMGKGDGNADDPATGGSAQSDGSTGNSGAAGAPNDAAENDAAGDDAAGDDAAGDDAAGDDAAGDDAAGDDAAGDAPDGAESTATIKIVTLSDAIVGHKPGDSVTLTVERDGEPTRDVVVVLAASPDDPAKAFLGVTYGGPMELGDMMMEAMPAMPAMPGMPGMPGMGDGNAMPDWFGQLGDDASGIVVGDVTADSAAAKAGIEAHDVISKVDGAALDGPEALAKAVAGHKPGDTITLTILRPNAAPRDVTATLGAREDDASKAFLGLSMTGFFLHRSAPGVV